jgi:hypothetical protein
MWFNLRKELYSVAAKGLHANYVEAIPRPILHPVTWNLQKRKKKNRSCHFFALYHDALCPLTLSYQYELAEIMLRNCLIKSCCVAFLITGKANADNARKLFCLHDIDKY